MNASATAMQTENAPDARIMDMLRLGIITHVFMLGAYGTVALPAWNHGRDAPLVLGITATLSVYIVDATYGQAVGALQVCGWVYMFVQLVLGAAYCGHICAVNDMPRGRANLVVLILILSMVMAISAQLAEVRGRCSSTMFVAELALVVPLKTAVDLLLHNLSSFDSSVRVHRWRLIVFVALWMVRVTNVWAGQSCMRAISPSRETFTCVMLDLAYVACACDVLWGE